jgi:hypothetical protein
MRQEVIVKSMLHRVSAPSNLVMVALAGGMFCLFQLLTPVPGSGPESLVLPFVLLFGHLALAPMPWQWSGDDRDRQGFGRGFLQALLFDLAWVALVLGALHLFTSPGQPPFGPHPHPPLGPEALPAPDLPPLPGLPPPAAWPRHPLGPFRPGLALATVNVAVALVYGWVVTQKEASDAEARRTATLLRQSQARALQNQLHPHVLYNALNSLSELIHEDPLAAEETTAKLADLYRLLTVHGETGLVKLEQERKLVEAYLDMEQMRLGERLTVHWDWPSWADAVELPPYFLLPLVENAIKHGISPSEQGGQVAVACLRRGAAIRLQVENTGCPPRGQSGGGVGLGNLEARLRLWSELSGRFRLEHRDGWTCASVQWMAEER